MAYSDNKERKQTGGEKNTIPLRGLAPSNLPIPEASQSSISHQLLLQAYANVKPMLVVNMAAAFCATFVLSHYNPFFAYIWMSVMATLSAFRGFGLTIYRRKLDTLELTSPDFLDVQRKAELVYGSGLLAAAFLWNGLLYEALRTHDEAVFFVTIIMAALAGGAMGVSAPLKIEGRFYISALLLPGAFVMAIAPEPRFLMATLAIVFWFVMIYGHNNNFLALQKAYLLQSTNESLVHDLQMLNASLEEKVARRTAELERVALRDPLTDLPNRRGFREMLHDELAKAETSGQKVAVGVIDLDGFKPVNDAFGHATGDELLVEVGKRLHASLGNKNYIARLGGDEFGFILTDAGSSTKLKEIGTEICTDLAAPYHLVGVVAEIGASVGLATFPHDTRNADELVEKADYALYHAKQERKGTATVFDSTHADEIQALARMEQVLKQADFSDELFVVYQPIIDVHSGQTHAFEALARWKSPILGDVPPGLFIRAAERSGQILHLTRYLLKQALDGAKHLPEQLRISVNLSARDIASMDAVDEIVQIVQNSDINPQRVVFEITETALVCDFDQAKAALQALHRIGTQIALDDFGTGHSSLSHLRLLPIDKLKIDSSFISDIITNQTSEDIVHTLVRLCDSMRIGCVVEGIETEAQLEKVHALGGRLIQGYYFARPMPLVDIAAHLIAGPQTSRAKSQPAASSDKLQDCCSSAI